MTRPAHRDESEATAATTPVNAYRTPEFGLLLLASRWPVQEGDTERVASAASKIGDWDRFVGLVRRHRTPGLTYNVLRQAGATLPAGTARDLAELARRAATSELLLLAETVRLAGDLEQHGVKVTILKGAPLAQRLYGRFGVRSSVDIDLLVGRDQVKRAATVVAGHGFRRIEPGEDVTGAALERHMAVHKDLVFRHPRSGVAVELHWRLFQNPHLMRAGEAPPTARALLGGREFSVLAPPFDLLYMCAHGAEHGWMRLKWLADLAAALRGRLVTPDDLYRVANPNLRALVGPGLMLSHTLLGTDNPGELSRHIASSWRMRRLFRNALDYIVGDEDATELEDRTAARMRKNMDHYLFSTDPRFWLSEMRYDFLDRASPEEVGASRLFRLARQIGRVAFRN